MVNENFAVDGNLRKCLLESLTSYLNRIDIIKDDLLHPQNFILLFELENNWRIIFDKLREEIEELNPQVVKDLDSSFSKSAGIRNIGMRITDKQIRRKFGEVLLNQNYSLKKSILDDIEKKIRKCMTKLKLFLKEEEQRFT